MKVIVAGYSKTGTKSMNAALSELGYNVLDYVDHFWKHGKEWNKILKYGGSVNDFRQMYENVDVVCDVPTFRYWEQIHEAFPDAKIILTEREEDKHIKSMITGFKMVNDISFISRVMGTLSPTSQRMTEHMDLLFAICFGIRHTLYWKRFEPNEQAVKIRKREHYCYVKQKAPSDKLLIFNVKEGWEPLCKFLGKEVPDKPFPWRNKNGSEIIPMMQNHPYGKQVEKECIIIGCCFVILLAIVIYCAL